MTTDHPIGGTMTRELTRGEIAKGLARCGSGSGGYGYVLGDLSVADIVAAFNAALALLDLREGIETKAREWLRVDAQVSADFRALLTPKSTTEGESDGK